MGSVITDEVNVGREDSTTNIESGVQTQPPTAKKHHHPFSELHIRIFAWGFLVLSHIGSIMSFFYTLNARFPKIGPDGSLEEASPALEIFGIIFMVLQYCYMPLIFLANFSIILRGNSSYFRSLLQYGGYTLGLFLVYIFVYFHYIVSLVEKVDPTVSRAEACNFIDEILSILFSVLRQLNFFIDLFICTLIAFFVLYRPKKIFTGKWLYVFRGFTVIPIVWSILGYVFLGINDGKTIQIPGYLFALIPLKPPVFLVVFIVMVFFLKCKERDFIKKGGTVEEYDAQFLSPESVHHFSVFTTVALIIGSVVDICFLASIGSEGACERVGIGQGALLFIVAPVIYFYDFSKGIKKPMLSIIIPAVAWVLIIFMWVEASHYLIFLLVEFLEGERIFSLFDESETE